MNYRQALFIIPLLFIATNFAWADNDIRAKPQHLKIAPATKSHGINIIHGAPQLQNTKATPPQPEEKAAKSNTPQIIETMPCYERSDKGDFLTDSITTYMKAQKRDPHIMDAIKKAAAQTQVDITLLLIKAMVESDLGRVTIAKNSTARGIYQYIEPTWLTLLSRYKDRIGYKIPLKKEDQLALRDDPYISAMIKAHQIKDETNALQLFKHNGRINATDHYIAHMLGLPLARRFYENLNNNSNEKLADSNFSNFKQAAKLNPIFFYDIKGNALNAHDAYGQFNGIISDKYGTLHQIAQDYGALPLTSRQDYSHDACNLPQVNAISRK